MVDNLIVGSGNFKFKVIQNWEKLPVGFSWRETAAVIADIEDNIYVFNRGNHPVIIFILFIDKSFLTIGRTNGQFIFH